MSFFYYQFQFVRKIKQERMRMDNIYVFYANKDDEEVVTNVKNVTNVNILKPRESFALYFFLKYIPGSCREYSYILVNLYNSRGCIFKKIIMQNFLLVSRFHNHF